MKKEFDVIKIEDVFKEYYPNLEFSPEFIESITNNFMPYFSDDKLSEFMFIACEKMDDPDSALRYFCGICRNKINESSLFRPISQVKKTKKSSFNHDSTVH